MTSPSLRWLPDDPRPLDWNGPATRLFTRFREQNLDRPIIEHFERVARRHRHRIAIRDANTALTFGELWDAVSGLADTLSADTEPGDLIAIRLPASSRFPVAVLACLAAGRPFVALDTHHPADWLGHVLREARPRRIITPEDLTSLPEPARKGWRPAAMGVDEPACVLFTSGSTGRPKSVVNSQRNLLQRVAQSINAAHVNATDRLLTLASPGTIVGVRDVITALLAGASVHLLDPHGVGAREIVNVVRREAITILFAFPALLRTVLAAREGRADAVLRLVRVGGDTTTWSDVEALRAWLARDASIQIVYAATEAPMMQWFVDDDCRTEDARVPIGYPLRGNRLAVIDEAGGPTRPGDIGELVVASRYVSLGEDVEQSGPRVFRTGDLVRQRPDGLLERIGRKDRQVKIRGSRVDLDGVEAMLRGHALVADVAAMTRPGRDGAATLVAYISARQGATAGLLDELRTSMRSAAPPMRPARYYLEPSIPRLPSSKLNVRALAALDEARTCSERGEASEENTCPGFADDDPISKTVARVWHDVLLVPLRSTEDDFFDSGGDSLNAITFVLELERALGIEVSLTLINEAPRFDRLCRALKERRAPSSTPLVTLKTGSGAPPVFFIHGVGGNVVEMLPTARRLTYAGEVIGIRARGAIRGERPHTRIEAMADDYLREIKKRQPAGPYHLCGYSSGGLVAFEIARRLSESGDEVGLVGLFDTTMSPVRWPLRTWLGITARRVAPAALRESLKHLRAWRLSLTAATWVGVKVAAGNLIASARYQPGLYRGELTLFSPAAREPALPSLESVWRSHARTVALVQTPGTHLTMLSTRHAETTAACITRCLCTDELPLRSRRGA